MDEKTTKNSKIMKVHYQDTMKIVFIGVYANVLAQWSMEVIFCFHIFEALNDNFEA